MGKARAIILRAAGTNCDAESAFAFEKAGAKAELVHINQLVKGEKELKNYNMLAIPGGFTYGDDIASGKILANELKYKMEYDLKRFIRDGKLIIGICNGFQVLVKAGLLPNLDAEFNMEVTLTLNDSARFEDRWVYLKNSNSKCVWTKGVSKEIIYLPVAHGEGKFVTKNETILKLIDSEGLVAFRYADQNGHFGGYPVNPNGSMDNIAGICDQTGRIFGLMPHPERCIEATQHPRWTRMPKNGEGDGLAIFKSGVEYAKKEL
ncbi:MAG: phosphoribosylformylglycinamidine synthase I [Candidatus Omnitrophica bacterium]|nr:phosphoribosylformylglycinamidine synthase I [Candidatus Omnitrophota bacterium]